MGLQIKYAIIAFLGVTLFVLSPLNQPVAKAWTGDLPTCSLGESLNDWSWKDKIRDFGFNNPDDINQVMLIAGFDNDPVSPNFNLLVMFPDYALVRQVGAVRSLSYGRPENTYGITKNPNHPSFQEVVTHAGPTGTTELSTSSLACITTLRNSSYETDYTGARYATTVPDQQDQCSTYDFTCKIAGVFQNISDDIRQVASTTLNTIVGFFIPDISNWQEQTTELRNLIDEKSGFLIFPIEILDDIVDAFDNNTNTWCTETNCTIEFGEIFGSDFNMNLLTLKNANPELHTLALLTIRLTVFLALIWYITNRYRQFIGERDR